MTTASEAAAILAKLSNRNITAAQRRARSENLRIARLSRHPKKPQLTTIKTHDFSVTKLDKSSQATENTPNKS
jgi:hypothetical protein